MKIKTMNWIKPSERLPKDQQECLITIKYDDKSKVIKARFNEDFGGYWNDNGFAYERIVAWMPCPEPFEE